MSESYGPVSTSSPDAPTMRNAPASTSTDISDVTDTAKAEAGHVVDTAKEEVATVAAEAKSQAKSLYAQAKGELRDQADKQQQRAAGGLRSAGDELRAMASSAPNPGLATDLVREASTRVNGLASWLGDRDPESLLTEVKSYARRRPGMFIGIAVLAGIAAGRLARALAEGNGERKPDMAMGAPRNGMGTADLTARRNVDAWTANGSPANGVHPPRGDAMPAGSAGIPVSEFEDAPVGESVAAATDWTDDVSGEGSGDDRRNSL